jgi:hypothetical protein
VIPRTQKHWVWNCQTNHFQLIRLQLDCLDSATLNCWGCGSQDDPLVKTGHKRRVWMSPESKISGLLLWAEYWLWFCFYGKLFLRNLCMDGEENTHSIKQSYNCWRLFFTSKIWNKGFKCYFISKNRI